MTYLDNQVAHESPPVAVSHPSSGNRTYVKVDPIAMWNVMEKMHATHTTGEQVLALRSDTDELGCSPFASDSWLLKLQEMYWKRCATALSSGAGPSRVFTYMFIDLLDQ